jgi:hypothetical protein
LRRPDKTIPAQTGLEVLDKTVPPGDVYPRPRAYLPSMGSGRRGTARDLAQAARAVPDPIILGMLPWRIAFSRRLERVERANASSEFAPEIASDEAMIAEPRLLLVPARL